MRAWLEVDLNVVSRNYDVIKQHVGESTGVIAVVKADAYGHGIEAIARTLDRKNVAGFAVISLDEAIRVRNVSDKSVLILGYLDNSEIEEAIAKGFILSLYDPELATLYNEIGLKQGRKVHVHLKVETGLNRLGMTVDHAESILANAASFSALQFESVYTHLSTSSNREQDLKQLEKFNEMRHLLDQLGMRIPVHMSNSHALMPFPEGTFDFVRVGLALYGVESVLPDLEPSLQCKTVVIQRKRLAKGEGVSYNKLFTAPQDMEIAVISIGYAEGLSQALTGKAEVLINGHRTPIIGQICMNLCTIDVTNIPAQRGDEVVIIGRQQDHVGNELKICVVDMARSCGLRHHEIITRLGKSLPRVYIDSQEPVISDRAAVLD